MVGDDYAAAARPALRVGLRPWTWLALAALAVALLTACGGGGDAEAVTPAIYGERTPAAGGTGKIYRGREIATIMSHRGAAWLSREEREKHERTDLLLERLPIETDSVVADLGAGSGYFTIPLAQRAPSGKVYAVDIQPEMLDLVRAKTTALGLTNVETVLATASDPGLPDASVDVVLIVDAYHEFSHPWEVMTAVVRALKPGGHVILVEYRGEDPRVAIHRLHKMTEVQVIDEMAAVGLEWVETDAFLPQQHFFVFRKAG